MEGWDANHRGQNEDDPQRFYADCFEPLAQRPLGEAGE
jgi:hypothetical protein